METEERVPMDGICVENAEHMISHDNHNHMEKNMTVTLSLMVQSQDTLSFFF